MASKEVSEAKLKERKPYVNNVKKEELEREQARNRRVIKATTELSGPKKVGKIDLDSDKKKTPKEEEKGSRKGC